MSINPDIPIEFDPEIAFAALGSIVAALRVSYGLKRLGLNACSDGSFLAEGWWGVTDCASGRGADANAALRDLLAQKARRK